MRLMKLKNACTVYTSSILYMQQVATSDNIIFIKATYIIRQQVFENHKGTLEWFATRSEDVVVYARKTLVNLDA